LLQSGPIKQCGASSQQRNLVRRLTVAASVAFTEIDGLHKTYGNGDIFDAAVGFEQQPSSFGQPQILQMARRAGLQMRPKKPL
jgi:hypothetical protein